MKRHIHSDSTTLAICLALLTLMAAVFFVKRVESPVPQVYTPAAVELWMLESLPGIGPKTAPKILDALQSADSEAALRAVIARAPTRSRDFLSQLVRFE